MLAGQRRGKRVFDDARKSGIGHDKTALPSAVEAMCQEAEGIGIPFEMRDVVPEAVAYPPFQSLSLAFSKECLDGLFAAVAERGITQIVSQTCRLDDGSNLLKERSPKFGVLLY